MAIRIAVSNQKGGVGKTTTGINIADAFTHCGYRVLYMDGDPQCNASSTYGAKIEDEYTLYDLLEKKCKVEEAIQHTHMGDIIAGDPKLAELEYKLMTSIKGYASFDDIIKKIESAYDFVIMETPPSLGIYMIAALTAATGVIIPIKAEKYAIDGLKLLINTINDVIENSNPDLRIFGILLTAYDKRNNLDKDLWKELPSIGEEIGMRVFKNPIRICQAVKEAQKWDTSLFEEYPTSTAASDYSSVVRELLEVINNG